MILSLVLVLPRMTRRSRPAELATPAVATDASRPAY
jgi:hypothetical protein